MLLTYLELSLRLLVRNSFYSLISNTPGQKIVVSMLGQ